ncbi:DUF4328 domain-containing protein [Streptomyces sp. NBC_01276]|uniref:DUF4328 domain-containing protein n=1 Tax=Streptomyces sp. NBC_01276 TaxID=2903808 RepID=UPI00352C0E94
MSFSAPGSPPPPPPPGQPPYGAAPRPEYPGPPGPAFPSPSYPAPAHPAYPTPQPAAPVLRSPRGLATAVTVLLCAAAVAALLGCVADLYTWSLMKDVQADPFAVQQHTLEGADLLTTLTGGFQGLTLLATAVVFVIWFHRVRTNGGIFNPGAFTRSAGWAVGAWFIPFGNLFLPYRVAAQTWAASVQLGPDGSFRRVSTVPLTSWWILWVLSRVLDTTATLLGSRADTPQALRTASALGAFAGLTTVAAAGLGIVFVLRLTALQNVKAVQGPYAAA